MQRALRLALQLALAWVALLVAGVGAQAAPLSLRERESARSNTARLQDVPIVRNMTPMVKADSIMFWRLQKVGSSTILSILMSYGFRHHFVPRRRSRANSFCYSIAKCAANHPLLKTDEGLSVPITPRASRRSQQFAVLDELAQSIPFKISLTHDLCNFNSAVIHDSLPCAFRRDGPTSELYSTGVKEIFMVREPLSRMASIYYFWGELFKMEQSVRPKQRPPISSSNPPRNRHLAARPARPRLGNARTNASVVGPLFTYHGQETTPPPAEIALAFASKFPLRRGFPGPSISSSAFAVNASDALQYMGRNEKMLTIVLERLDESLVVLRHFLNWSLADVVVTHPRKALSRHPKIEQWPAEAVQLLRAKLINAHEYEIYDLAKQQLDARISSLTALGVNVSAEVQLLQAVRNRVKEVCLQDSHLQKYQRDLERRGFPQHNSGNKLRDVDDKYYEERHIFSMNGEILCSFDVCGGCEAHALLLGARGGVTGDLETAVRALPTYFELPQDVREGSVHFRNCPAE